MIARRTLFFLSLCQFQSPLTLPYLLPLPPPSKHYSNSHCYYTRLTPSGFLPVSPQALAVGQVLVSQAHSSLSSHSLGKRFVSPQMHCPHSHYIFTLFFWLNICLVPVFFPLFSHLQSCPILSLVLAYPTRPSFFLSSLSYSLASFFWLNISFSSLLSLLQSRPIFLASCLFRLQFPSALLPLYV